MALAQQRCHPPRFHPRRVRLEPSDATSLEEPGLNDLVTTPFMINPDVLTNGAKPSPRDHPSPFKFAGPIHKVTVDVSGELIHDPEAELRAHMARQ